MAKLQETKNNETNLKTARENKTAVVRLLADFLEPQWKVEDSLMISLM